MARKLGVRAFRNFQRITPSEWQDAQRFFQACVERDPEKLLLILKVDIEWILLVMADDIIWEALNALRAPDQAIIKIGHFELNEAFSSLGVKGYLKRKPMRFQKLNSILFRLWFVVSRLKYYKLSERTVCEIMNEKHQKKHERKSKNKRGGGRKTGDYLDVLYEYSSLPLKDVLTKLYFKLIRVKLNKRELAKSPTGLYLDVERQSVMLSMWLIDFGFGLLEEEHNRLLPIPELTVDDLNLDRWFGRIHSKFVKKWSDNIVSRGGFRWDPEDARSVDHFILGLGDRKKHQS